MRRWAKRWRVSRRAVSRRLSLSARFLIVAAFTVAVASILLGFLITRFLESGILDGVARTASASIEAIIYPSVRDLRFDPDLEPNEVAQLDEIFALRREADSTRLLQFELRRPTGELVYRSDGGLVDDTDGQGFLAALADDTLFASIRDVRLESSGPFPQYRLSVIRIVTSLSRPGEAAPFGIAIMYFSARALFDIEGRITAYVWGAVAVIGFGVVLALFANVNRTSRLVAKQRSMLARSAADWRKLARENNRLHLASEQLRLNANSANESLLVRVGSDIHDGPVQVLALLVLKLSDTGVSSENSDEFTGLAQDAMDELRNISAGLVLPELSSLSLVETLRHAVSRHERSFGTTVTTMIGPLPEAVSMALRTCAYRVVQEGLNNGYRHGSKGSQRVEATQQDSRLELSISNQNRHAAASALSSPADQIGLIGMRLRVEALGGHMSVELGEMTFLRVSIPITSHGRPGRKAPQHRR
jgi:signal transduction histidine kinase